MDSDSQEQFIKEIWSDDDDLESFDADNVKIDELLTQEMKSSGRYTRKSTPKIIKKLKPDKNGNINCINCVNCVMSIMFIIEFGLQAKPSNLYREFVLLAAPRDNDYDRDFFL